jgi:excisionase family DNA binding protein
MSDLYTTRTAALLLGVSEASVRRWSDSGLLPVQRIGRRRARRFAGADLRQFLAGQAQPVTGGWAWPAPATRPRIEAHDHLATFYDGEAARLRLSVPFLREGLLGGDRCFLVASAALTGAYFDALSDDEGVDPEAAVASGSLVTRSGVGSSARAAIATWEQLFWQALGSGAGAIRVVGEMATYDGFSQLQEILDYEVAYDSTAKRFPVMTLCQYDVGQFDGRTLLGAMKAHPDLFVHRLAQVLL